MLLEFSHQPGVCKMQILIQQAWVEAVSAAPTGSQVVPSCPARTTREQRAAGMPPSLSLLPCRGSSYPCLVFLAVWLLPVFPNSLHELSVTDESSEVEETLAGR